MTVLPPGRVLRRIGRIPVKHRHQVRDCCIEAVFLLAARIGTLVARDLLMARAHAIPCPLDPHHHGPQRGDSGLITPLKLGSDRDQ